MPRVGENTDVPEWRARYLHVREQQRERWVEERHQVNLRSLETLVNSYRAFNDALARRMGGKP